MEESWDVAVCGGGLAGLCIARQLRGELPSARIVVIEPSPRPLPEATLKVGESSVELGSHYFEHALGLGDYLRERHLIKNGLRFFGGPGHLPLAKRTEIGPPELPVVPSYQIDRGRFENDLRAFIEADGVTLIEGEKVLDVELSEDGGLHRVIFESGELSARWVVDATGRRRLLARKLGICEELPHSASAAWLRLDGKLDIADLVPASDEAWHARDPQHIRWLSTNHLMGEGYWVWLIPLPSGHTSVGLVVHDEVHPFDTFSTRERFFAWIEEHEPALAGPLSKYEVEDFHVLRSFSHTAKRVFSEQRWALVGEAGAFVDPFYSPGSDFVALANTLAVQCIRADFAGEDFATLTHELSETYLRFASEATETYRLAAKVYANPRILAAKIYWDNINYWSFPCHYFIQEIYRLPLEEQRPFFDLAARFSALHRDAQRLFALWAEHASDVPHRKQVRLPAVPSGLASLHVHLARKMTSRQTRDYLEDNFTLACEVLGDLIVRALAELGPDAAKDAVQTLALDRWDLTSVRLRLSSADGSASKNGKRRHRLPKASRDMERCLGRPPLHQDYGSLGEVTGLLP